MADIKGAGPRPTWLGRLQAQRTAEHPPIAPRGAARSRDARAPEAPAAEVLRNEGLFAELAVPSKVVARHGAALEPALADITELARLTRSMPGAASKKLGRVVEFFYGVLAKELNELPADAEAAVATETVAAFASLAKACSRAPDDCASALFAAVGLYDATARLQARGGVDRGPRGAAAREAVAFVEGLMQRLEGRPGLSTLLAVLPNWAEQLDVSGAKATRAGRAKNLDALAKLVETHTPRSGVDLFHAGEVTSGLARALDAAKGDVAKALAALEDELSLARHPTFTAAEEATAALAKPAAKALGRVLDANVAGPTALFDGVRALAERIAPLAPADQGLVAAALGALAERPSIASLVDRTGVLLDRIDAPGVREALAALPKVKTAGDQAKLVAEALFAAHGREPAPELARFAGGSSSALVDAALVLVDHLVARAAAPEVDGALATALVERVGRGDLGRAAETLSAFAARFEIVAAAFDGEVTKRRATIAKLADVVFAGGNDAARVIAHRLRLVEGLLPAVDVAELAVPLARLEDPAVRRFNPPDETLEPLFRLVGEAPKLEVRDQVALARAAIEIVDEVSRLGGNIGPFVARVLTDFERAAAGAKELAKPAASKGVIAARAGRDEHRAVAFFAAHAELPPELRFTAGLALSTEQLGWLGGLLAESKSLTRSRAIRDFTFACVAANRIDVLDAARTSRSNGKAVERAMTELAQRFRADQLANAPFDVIGAGLAKGIDVMGELSKQKNADALAALNLGEIAREGALDPEGMKALEACRQHIGLMLEQYRPGFRPPMDTQLDYGQLREPVMRALASVADGTWPAPKYETEPSRRIMGRLTPRQQQLWREEKVTYVVPPAGPKDDAAAKEALALVRGVYRAFADHVRPVVDGAPVALDAASLTALRAQQSALLDELHRVEKGSDAHRSAGAKMREVSSATALVELHQALARTFEKGEVADPTAALVELRPLLDAARGRFRAVGASSAFEEAVRTAADAAAATRTAPKQGKYALDEDDLVGLLTANTSGCLSTGNPARFWGHAAVLTEPQIRRLRVMNGDQQTFRAFLRFVPIEVEGYKGMALFVDNPVGDGGGGEEDRKLLHQHALEKGLAMGLPVCAGALYADYYRGWEHLAAEGRARGLEVKENVGVKMFFEEGNVPYHHSDCLLNDNAGGVNFHGRIRDHRGDQPFWERDFQLKTIVFPR